MSLKRATGARVVSCPPACQFVLRCHSNNINYALCLPTVPTWDQSRQGTRSIADGHWHLWSKFTQTNDQVPINEQFHSITQKENSEAAQSQIYQLAVSLYNSSLQSVQGYTNVQQDAETVRVLKSDDLHFDPRLQQKCNNPCCILATARNSDVRVLCKSQRCQSCLYVFFRDSRGHHSLNS